MNRLPKCRNCKTRFTPRFNNSLTKFCCKTEECIAAFLALNKANQLKANRKETKSMREAIKTPQQYKKDLQTEINKIARLIDKDHPCMMCASFPMKRINGCHYHSVGSNDTLRFNLLNVWHGCHSCNGERGGNIPGYDIQLMGIYGRKKWEYIKFEMVQTKPIHLNKEEIKVYIKKARLIVKELTALDLKYSTENRWKLREKYNKRLGIYS